MAPKLEEKETIWTLILAWSFLVFIVLISPFFIYAFAMGLLGLLKFSIFLIVQPFSIFF